MDFKNQNVLVTGASRGIGLAVAKAFAAKGAHVILTARDEKKLQEETAGIIKNGGSAWCHKMDITSDEQVQVAVDAALAKFERVDVLINNAGVSYQGFFAENNLKNFQQEFEVNCIGTMRVTHALLPSMIQHRNGTIINISSMLGMAPFPTGASYSATKAAIIAFSQALRGEISQYGIHVGAFLPGHTKTDMGEDLVMKGGPTPVAVDSVAADILDTVARKRKLATISGLAANLGVHLMRHLPGVAEKMMKDIAMQSLPQQN